MNQEAEVPLYSEKGGVRAGLNYWISCNFTYPFAKLSLYSSHLSIKYPFAKITILIDELQSVMVINRPFGKGFQFLHNNAIPPKYVLFWSFKPDKLEAALKQYHFWRNETGTTQR